MTAPRPVLTFESLGTGEIAKLGERACGMILAHQARPRATWSVRLMDWPHRSGPASSIADARTRIIEQVEEWCASLGWIDPDAGVEVRIPAEERKRA